MLRASRSSVRMLQIHRFLITSEEAAEYMVYVFVGADGITSGMYILVEFSIFRHPLKSGEFVDMTGLSDLIVD